MRHGMWLVVLASVLWGCTSTTNPPRDPLIISDQILDDLRTAQITLTFLGPSRAMWLSNAPGAAYKLDTGWLHIHAYPDTAVAQATAARIPPTADTGMTDWVDVPHFFRCDSLIILYLGREQRVLEILETHCGAQFAGQ